MRRLSRPCYDKPHRCPGWAGGGLKYPKTDRCDGGRITVNVIEPAHVFDGIEFEATPGHPGAHPWRFGRCNTCTVMTLPFALRRLDPTNWRSMLRMALANWRYERSWNR
jgi:hypothetical protein